MFVLDTNVISELMRDSPHSEVLAWLDKQLASALFVTTITEAEIRTVFLLSSFPKLAGEERGSRIIDMTTCKC